VIFHSWLYPVLCLHFVIGIDRKTYGQNCRPNKHPSLPSKLRRRVAVQRDQRAVWARGETGAAARAASWVFRPEMPIKSHLDTILKYQTNYVMQPTTITGTCSCIQFKVNSTYKPEVTYSGHQPYLRDQIVACGYGYYYVHCAKVTIHAAVNASSTNAALLLTMRANTDAGSDAGSDTSVLLERPYTKGKIISVTKPAELSLIVYPADLMGIPRKEGFNTNAFISGVGSDPGQGAYVNVSVQDSDHLGYSSALNVQITIEQQVRWFATYAVSQS